MEICLYDDTLSFRLAVNLQSEHAVRICVTLATKSPSILLDRKQTVQFTLRLSSGSLPTFCAS